MARRSLDECRALLGPDAEGMSDADVLELRDAMYAFASSVQAVYVAGRKGRTDTRQRATAVRGATGSPRRPHLKGAER